MGNTDSTSPVRVRKFEFRRKALHSSIGFLSLYLWLTNVVIINVIYSLSIALVIIVSADFLRFRSPPFARFYESVLGFLMRPSERHQYNGVIWYLLGVIICLVIFPIDIAVLSICVLSWCDTAASTVGRTLGRYTPALPFPGLFARRKSLAGTLGAIGMGYFIASIFWGRLAKMGHATELSWQPANGRWVLPGTPRRPPQPDWLPRLPKPHSTLKASSLYILTGLIAGLSEAIDVWGLDDNLSLPVLFGLSFWAALWIAG